MSMLESINFPTHFPSNCPPVSAECYNGNIYMFIQSDHPKLKNFRTNYDRNRLSDADPCLRRALSCGISMEYIEKMKSMFPVTKGWRIAVGNIKNNDGVVIQTTHNTTHYSFWMNQNIKDSVDKKFKVIV